MIDSHIHLDADQYADVAALIKRARDAGVKAVVAPGITPSANRRVIELARSSFHAALIVASHDDDEHKMLVAKKLLGGKLE